MLGCRNNYTKNFDVLLHVYKTYKVIILIKPQEIKNLIEKAFIMTLNLMAYILQPIM